MIAGVEHLTDTTDIHAGGGVGSDLGAAPHVMIGTVVLWADDRATLHRRLTEAVRSVEALGATAADVVGDEAALA